MIVSSETILKVGKQTLKISKDNVSLDGLYFRHLSDPSNFMHDNKETILKDIADHLKLVDVLREHVEGLEID
jgi:hypothetical protein